MKAAEWLILKSCPTGGIQSKFPVCLVHFGGYTIFVGNCVPSRVQMIFEMNGLVFLMQMDDSCDLSTVRCNG